jgi:hypothetical protein
MVNFTTQGRNSPVKSREKGLLVENNDQGLSSNCQDTELIETVVNKVRDSEDQGVESEGAINR